MAMLVFHNRHSKIISQEAFATEISGTEIVLHRVIKVQAKGNQSAIKGQVNGWKGTSLFMDGQNRQGCSKAVISSISYLYGNNIKWKMMKNVAYVCHFIKLL
ncbi:hypothetical protein A9P82_10640 [Arachidicoccus ginsenosidimutans]|uniref:hypothetical protein n=1 Tax=Arachidicoccus sp. BS20 TaxID=1850526 RepID=UPI0007F0BC7F|nr:hypothetical protein [Arachidicoccus sp. BS20]ANI89705.1 hypothetical protein A9P82_10640 [Arachidicoccus sp. BS20]